MGVQARKTAILVFADGVMVSSDALVTAETAAALFGLKKAIFYRVRRKITANHGLQAVKVGKRHRYRLKSIEAVIKRCAEREIPLYETNNAEQPAIFLKPIKPTQE